MRCAPAPAPLAQGSPSGRALQPQGQRARGTLDARWKRSTLGVGLNKLIRQTGEGPSLVFPCLRLLLCPAGGRPLGAGSPPLAVRRDSSGHDPAARPGVGPLGVRKQPRRRYPAPVPHAGDPVASEAMAAPPASGSFPPPEGLTKAVCEGGIQSVGAAGGRSLRSPRAPDARAALGRRRRVLMRTPRGPSADRALRSRAEESAGAGRGGHKPADSHRGTGNRQKASRSEKEESDRSAPGGKEHPRMSKKKNTRTAAAAAQQKR
jgi:hypothetical protein